MTRNKCLAVLLFTFAFMVSVCAQNQPKPQIKHVPIKPTSAASGLEMYKNYCAACHGATGIGDGPAVPALKTVPPDLTALAKKSGGKYPAMRVAAILRGEETLPAHGSKEMPIWGNLFWTMSSGHGAEVQQRISNLNAYVESLQKN